MNSSNAAWLLIAAFFLFFNGCKRTTGHSGIFANSSVLLVTIDTVRADHLGCYGYKTASTPTIDGLAASGGRFARAYAHNVVTLPSHANILSGLYPIQHGIRDNTGFRFPKNADTVATLLKARGFACGAFIGAFPVDSRFGLDRGFDVYDESYGDTTRAQDFRFVERRAEEVITPFLNWLDQQKKGTRWFAWVHLYDAHSPYDPPEPYRTQFAGRLYEGEIAYVDAQIGRALDHLRETGWLGSTYVIITADHGEGLGDHNEPTHGIFAYEATLHIPLVIAGPGIAPGVVRSTVRHIDILPTILDLTGSVIPGILNGKSLQPLLFGHSDPAGGRDLYFEAISASLNRDWAPLTGVIAGASEILMHKRLVRP